MTKVNLNGEGEAMAAGIGIEHAFVLRRESSEAVAHESVKLLGIQDDA